jgi:putative ABC transport system substrate-binding protein
MRRRGFIEGIVALTAARPLAAGAQQSSVPVIGFLNGGSPEGFSAMVNAFREGLREVGYVEGQNVAVGYRWANDRYRSLRQNRSVA